MSQYTSEGHKTFAAGQNAIGDHLRVAIDSSGQVVVAGATDLSIGTSVPTNPRVAAVGDPQTVRLRTAQGTRLMVGAKAIPAGAEIYSAAAGRVTDEPGEGAVHEGTALEPCAAAGAVFEVLPLGNTTLTVEVPGP